MVTYSQMDLNEQNNILLGKLNQITEIFIQENALENSVSNTSAI